MKESSLVFIASNATPISFPEPGLQRQVLAFNPQLMLVRHHMTQGWQGALHSHPHSQLVYIVSGYIRFESENKTQDLYAGDSIVVAGNVEHQATALEDSEVLDVFTPYREDYLAAV